MTYPNQYYPQQNNYMYPQYVQAQQRQEQLNQVFANSYTYNFTRDRAEAENWPIAPGNTFRRCPAFSARGFPVARAWRVRRRGPGADGRRGLERRRDLLPRRRRHQRAG